MTYPGFPRRLQFTPVPNPLFGPLLEEVDDLAELKCTLRVIWLLHQKKGYPRFVSLAELLADRTLAKALSRLPKKAGATNVEAALGNAVRRGTLIRGSLRRDGAEEHLYALNVEAQRRALAAVTDGLIAAGPGPRLEDPQSIPDRPNIFVLYEDNIGLLNPMIAEELKEAEELYPASWIEDAFREAVAQNKRSWRYVARILERWDREGKKDGRAGRHSKKAGYF